LDPAAIFEKRQDTAKKIYGALQYLVITAISGSLLELVEAAENNPLGSPPCHYISNAFNAFYFDRRVFFLPPRPELSLVAS
jgi:hypothetical protein